MAVKKISDTLVQITNFGIMNCYIVKESDGLTVIDTGMAGTAKTILSAAEDMGQPIKRVLLTHAHPDHITCTITSHLLKLYQKTLSISSFGDGY